MHEACEQRKPRVASGGRESNRGFTLIELMITLTIVAILTFMAAPSMKSFIYTERLAGQARDMVGDLNYARSEAIRRGGCTFSTATSSYQGCVTVCKQLSSSSTPQCDTTVNSNWSAGRIIFVDTNLNGQVDPGELVLRWGQPLDGSMSNGNTMLGDNTSTGTGLYAVYLSDGTLLIPPLTPAVNQWTNDHQWLLCDNRGHLYGLAVVVSASGRVRMTDPGLAMSGSISSSSCPP